MSSLLMAGALAAAAAQGQATPVQTDPGTADLLMAVRAERRKLDEQQQALDAQRRRLEMLEARLVRASEPHRAAAADVPGPVSPPPPATVPIQTVAAAPGSPVGEAPAEQAPPAVAVLGREGGILSKAGKLSFETDFQYTRADDNRVLFRGVQVPASVLIGVFDITENHQDLLTLGFSARLGLSSRLEISGRLPLVYRSERTVLTPVAEPADPATGRSSGTVSGSGLGDIELGVRYQLTDSDGATPYLIAAAQVIVPTGSDPFAVPFDELGASLRSATGSGFWGLASSVVAIFPSDPAVLYGSIGYTVNLARSIDRTIGPAYIERVAPGSEPSASVGVALSVNPDLSLSFGYAHTMVFGSVSRLRGIDAVTGAIGPAVQTRTRDLQLGRLLFGLSYRASARTTLNWTLEAGQTEDAPDLRLALRVPIG